MTIILAALNIYSCGRVDIGKCKINYYNLDTSNITNNSNITFYYQYNKYHRLGETTFYNYHPQDLDNLLSKYNNSEGSKQYCEYYYKNINPSINSLLPISLTCKLEYGFMLFITFYLIAVSILFYRELLNMESKKRQNSEMLLNDGI